MILDGKPAALMSEGLEDESQGILPKGARVLYLAGDFEDVSGTMIYVHEGKLYERYREAHMTEAEVKPLSGAYVRGLLDAAYLNMLDAIAGVP